MQLSNFTITEPDPLDGQVKKNENWKKTFGRCTITVEVKVPIEFNE